MVKCERGLEDGTRVFGAWSLEPGKGREESQTRKSRLIYGKPRRLLNAAAEAYSEE